MARNSEAALATGALAVGPVAVGLVPSSVPSTMPAAANASAGGAELPVSDAVFLGTVKSYNDRRGFGFIACAETLATYGRDVYMAKAEVQHAGEAGPAGLEASSRSAKHVADVHGALRIAEEDIVRFQVRLSVEGYPQAANVQRLRKFRGMVVHPPAEEGSNLSCTSEDDSGTVISEELQRTFGDREASLKREDCGQVRLTSGDEITFCVPEVPESDGAMLEAKQVVLLKTNRFSRAILGCFSLRLPRPRVGHHRAQRKDLRVDCHAFNDRIIIAGLPGDCDEGELRRFFSKQGATDTLATRAKGCGFASVSFPSIVEVAKLLSRTAHAFTDDKETQIATLHGRRVCGHPHADTPRLPALPAPSLTPGEVAGTLHVNWSPLVLAVGYVVEMRQSGVRAAWAAVDGVAGCLKAGASRFEKDRSTCKVSGLDATSAYEARVTYLTSCGCKAEASDISERCIPCPGARLAPYSTGISLGHAVGTNISPGVALPSLGAGAIFGNAWPSAAVAAAASIGPMHVQAPAPAAWPMNLGLASSHGLVTGMPQVQQVLQPPPVHLTAPPAALVQSENACLAGSVAAQASGWRCAHGAVIPPPPLPEVCPADEHGFAISVRWPSVSHAAAYVVELREGSSSSVERFMRSAPMATRGSIVELRIGGLRPSGSGGQRYSAQVRCIAECGCESNPSEPGWHSTLQAAPQSPVLPPMASAIQDAAAAAAASPQSTAGGGGVPVLLPQLVQEPHRGQQSLHQAVGSPIAHASAPQWLGFSQPQPEALLAAVGVPPSWAAPMSGSNLQPTAVAIYSQVLDSSPSAAAAGLSNAATGESGQEAVVPQPGLPMAAAMQHQQKVASVKDRETPPELTGCEVVAAPLECLLLD
mmetsp:Transcript_18879/g.44354  ORF Transcript_18879/g.44354 Transcript_18879/m.44354 type:complete len:873 (+) Transcript_18879:41-2659(+)